jgi:phosphohistidine phosphatase
MKTLMLLRHAKSSKDDPQLDDHERPLTKRGKEAAKRIGRLIRDEKIVPDLIISSTAVRARKTAEKAAEESKYQGAIELEERLYLADPERIYAVVREFEARRERVLLVAHNPGISDFLSRLVQTEEEMPTAALAVIELPIASWSKLSAKTRGRVLNYWKPRELD